MKKIIKKRQKGQRKGEHRAVASSLLQRRTADCCATNRSETSTVAINTQRSSAGQLCNKLRTPPTAPSVALTRTSRDGEAPQYATPVSPKNSTDSRGFRPLVKFEKLSESCKLLHKDRADRNAHACTEYPLHYFFESYNDIAMLLLSSKNAVSPALEPMWDHLQCFVASCSPS